jgi:hypothetical protein
MPRTTISSESLDALIEILDVQVYDEKYYRWVRNGEIRVSDIWDVIDDTLMMTILDHRSDAEDIQQSVSGILHHVGGKSHVDADDFNQTHDWISDFNETSKDVIIVGFGVSWDDGDSVAILALHGEQWERIRAHGELSELFYAI